MMELKDRKFYEGVCEGETFEEGSAFYTRLLDTAEIIEEEGYDVLTDNNGNLLAYALYPNYRDVDDIRSNRCCKKRKQVQSLHNV